MTSDLKIGDRVVINDRYPAGLHGHQDVYLGQGQGAWAKVQLDPPYSIFNCIGYDEIDLVPVMKPQKGDRVKITYEAEWDGALSGYGAQGRVALGGGHGANVPNNATIEIIKRAEPPKPTVKELLDALPDDPDKIAVLLGQQGIVGKPRTGHSCPVAHYLNKILKPPHGCGARVTAFGTNIVNIVGAYSSIENPPAVRCFVENFDKGLYPWLEEKS